MWICYVMISDIDMRGVDDMELAQGVVPMYMGS